MNASTMQLLERRTLMSTWTTVDADPSAVAINAMAGDKVGNVYAAGDSWDAGSVIPVLKQKTAGGADWSTIFAKPAGDFTAVATDPAGDVFVGGDGRGADGKFHWLIYEQPAGQTGFSVVDDQPQGECSGLATDAAGDVYAVGDVRVITVTSTKGKTTTTTT